MRVGFCAFMTSALYKGEWSASRTNRLHPPKRASCKQWLREPPLEIKPRPSG